MSPLPTFDDLPIQKNGPPLNAWGLYGTDDELGRLNLITLEAVKRGRDSIKHGEVINLNLPLDIVPVIPGRPRPTHEILHMGNYMDDSLSFNTQGSTQWDGFRHWPYQDYPGKGEYRYYGGMTTEQVADPADPRCGIQNIKDFASKPITSRGVLLDIPLYLSKSKLPPLSPLDDCTPVTLDMLKGAAELQLVTFQPGDILLVHTGWTAAFCGLSLDEQVSSRIESTGVQRGLETLRWHWENGFAAVASDVKSYELFSFSNTGLSLHEAFLAGWGMPIGELFDLRRLAERCEALQQWTFLFTSMVMITQGGIASPPNAQAILTIIWDLNAPR